MSANINSIKRNLIDRYPFFGSIVDSLDYIETKNCVSYNGSPTAGTNGNTIYYHPDFIDNLSESQQTFVFAHEVCHIAFDHINRGKDKDQEVWNYATDSVINAFLKKDGLELVDGVVDIPWAIRYDAEEMYNKLMKKKQRQQKKNKQNNNNQNSNGQNNNQKDVGHDTHSFWNEKSIDKNKDDIIKEMQKQFSKMGEKETLKKKNSNELKEMLKKIKKSLEEMQKSQKTSDENAELGFGIGGKGAGTDTLEESVNFDDVGTSYPLINWPLILKKPIEIVELDWSYQNAYLEDGVVSANLEESSYLLSYETEIVLDTSGSIDDELLRSFLRECKNILNFSKIKVGCFDTKFYGFTEIKNMKDIDEFTFVGRGGTDFSVAVSTFSQKADNKIIFTDGQAYMPSKELDAIWVVFGDSKISPKGGKVIYVDKNKLIKLSQEHDSMMLTKTKGSVRR